jgi:hypothetical protein
LSADEYAKIKAIVFWRIPHDWCDREDALQFGLLRALEHCESHEFKSIKTYAVEAAYHYAYNTFFRPLNRMTIPTERLAERGKSGEKEVYQDVWDRIVVTHDRYPSLEELDQTLVDQIEHEVKAHEWDNGKGKPRSISPVRADRAIQTLHLFAESVRNDAGIGVDEFGIIPNDRPTNPRQRGKYRFEYQTERRLVRKHLKERLGSNADRTVHALRQCAAKVILERGC